MDLAPLVYEPMTFVVLDATSPDGEAALGALTDADQHITLLALLGHRSAGAIHDFAAAEQLSAPEAADVYLDQAAERVSADRDRLVQTVVSAEADMVRTVREFVALENVRRVVVSRSLLADDPTSASEALRRLPVEVEIVGPRPMSSDRSRRSGSAVHVRRRRTPRGRTRRRPNRRARTRPMRR